MMIWWCLRCIEKEVGRLWWWNDFWTWMIFVMQFRIPDGPLCAYTWKRVSICAFWCLMSSWELKMAWLAFQWDIAHPNPISLAIRNMLRKSGDNSGKLMCCSSLLCIVQPCLFVDFFWIFLLWILNRLLHKNCSKHVSLQHSFFSRIFENHSDR